MESKLLLEQATADTVRELLIEPVWNRNVYDWESEYIAATFNRTSMESKQPSASKPTVPGIPFNRTSMESKLT